MDSNDALLIITVLFVAGTWAASYLTLRHHMSGWDCIAPLICTWLLVACVLHNTSFLGLVTIKPGMEDSPFGIWLGSFLFGAMFVLISTLFWVSLGNSVNDKGQGQ